MTKIEEGLCRRYGYLDGYRGLSGNGNPYKKRSIQYLLWENGWISGQKAREEEYGQKTLSDSH